MRFEHPYNNIIRHIRVYSTMYIYSLYSTARLECKAVLTILSRLILKYILFDNRRQTLQALKIGRQTGLPTVGNPVDYI